MTSTYLSSLLSSTTSRYNNLRRALLSDEVDGDTEADSHISRVLRAYYVEKGRPFPPWLPPDSHGYHSTSSQYGQSAARQQGQMAPTRRAGGLSDLFDSPSQSGQPQPSISLRRGGQLPGRSAGQPTPAGFGTGSSDSYNVDDPTSLRPQRPQPSGARPMQDSRDAGFQSQAPDSRSGNLSSAPSLRSATGSGSGGTAQDKLKAKLWGASRSLNSRDPYGRGASGG